MWVEWIGKEIESRLDCRSRPVTLNKGEADANQKSEYYLLMPCGDELSTCLALGRGQTDTVYCLIDHSLWTWQIRL
jgi:hypothetical protein